MQRLQRCAINAIRLAIVLILAVTAVALWAGPEASHGYWLAFRLYISGKAGPLNASETVEAVRLSVQQVKEYDAVHRNAKLVTEDPDGFACWDTPAGRYWVPAKSAGALEWDLAEQARGIYGKGEKGVRAGDVVLDCGANVGVYARKALAGGARLVVAIEPGPENVECLRRNLAAEIAAGKVIVYPKGVWDREDVLTLHSDPANSARDSLLPLTGAGIREVRVPLTTIDKLMEELRLPRVDYIKMDIEGAERNAIRGAGQTLRKYKPRMALCIYHLPEDPVEVPRAVRGIVPTYSVSLQGLWRKDAVSPEVAHFR